MKPIRKVSRVLFIGVIVGRGPTFLLAQEPVLSDRRISHQVHSDIVADASLPYCAHIVEVQAKHGTVILKGRVHTEEQKERIEHKAARVVGEESIINNIVVKEP
jgi:hyperosmotically inducible protein